MAQRIQFRQDTSIRWTAINPVLAMGEPAYETDTGKQKIGDGKTAYKLLPYKLEVGPQGIAGPAGPQGPVGLTGDRGLQGIAGPVGGAGPSSILSIGSVTGGLSASATLVGTSPSQILNLVLPKGDTGATGQPCSLSIGSVGKGTSPSATISGTAPAQVLNLILPQGDQGQQGTQGIQGIAGPVGPKGDTGAVGAGVVIQGTFTAWPPAPSASAADGDLWILGAAAPVGAPAGSVIGDGFVFDKPLNKWINVGQIRGPQGLRGDTGPVGPQGPVGPSNSLAIGTVTAGTLPSATITGTAPSQSLNLVLPKGDQGIQGAQGAVGAAGPTGAIGPANTLTVGTVTAGAAGTNPAVTITGTAPSQTVSFTIPRGDRGEAGTYVTSVLPLTAGISLQFAADAVQVGKLFHFTKKAADPALSNVIGLYKGFSDAVPVGSQITLLHDMPEPGAAVTIISIDPTITLGQEGEQVGFLDRPAVLDVRYRTARLYKVSSTRWIVSGDLSNNMIQITTQPQDVSASDGMSVSFTTRALASDSPIFYQWQTAAAGTTVWSDIAGGTSITLTVTATTAQNGRQYRCVARTALAGSVTSAVATLTVSIPDGSKWAVTAGGSSPKGVNFGNGLFVNASGLWSSDGKAWNAPLGFGTGGAAPGTRPVFGNGTWLTASGTAGFVWYTSADGKNWVTRARPYDNRGNVVFGFGFGRFVAFWTAPYTGTIQNPPVQYAHSTDGINWTLGPAITGLSLYQITGIATGSGGNANMMIAVGQGVGGAASSQYLASADGITWVAKVFPSAQIVTDIAYSNSNSNFVVVATGNVCFVSPASTTPLTTATIGFTASKISSTANWSSITFGNSRWVAVAANSATAATSTNGTAWVNQVLPTNAVWNGVTFGSNKFVAVALSASAVSE